MGVCWKLKHRQLLQAKLQVTFLRKVLNSFLVPTYEMQIVKCILIKCHYKITIFIFLINIFPLCADHIFPSVLSSHSLHWFLFTSLPMHICLLSPFRKCRSPVGLNLSWHIKCRKAGQVSMGKFPQSQPQQVLISLQTQIYTSTTRESWYTGCWGKTWRFIKGLFLE